MTLLTVGFGRSSPLQYYVFNKVILLVGGIKEPYA